MKHHGIQMVGTMTLEVVADVSLETATQEGRIVYNQADELVYRCNGSSWQAIGGLSFGSIAPSGSTSVSAGSVAGPVNFESGNDKLTITGNNTSKTITFTVNAETFSFLTLTDTPSAYSGQASKVVAVNSGADALEFLTNITDDQHGSRSGGTLHSVATSAVAGFMSSTDKQNVDNLTTAFPTGTKMWFYQSAAPTGWTIVASVGDRLLGVSDASTLYDSASGGSNAGNWTGFTNHTHGAGTFAVSGTTGNDSAGSAQGYYNVYNFSLSPHTHTFAANVTGTSAAETTSWRPSAAVGIICTKN